MASDGVEDADLTLARQLQDQFDQEPVEVSSDDEDPDHQLAKALQKRYDEDAQRRYDEKTRDLSNSKGDDVVIIQDAEPARPVRNSHFTADERKVFRAEREDLNEKEYFIEELQTYVDPDNNFEWKFVEVMPDLRAMFDRLDETCFQSRFKAKRFSVVWSQIIGEHCTNRNLNGPGGIYTIALNEVLLALRPRLEIMSCLLHEMIHCYMKMEKIKEPNGGHGPNFRKIMFFLNRMLQTNISFSHRLHTINMACRTQWYRCTGICHNYMPFKGLVRCFEGEPGLQNEWWKSHAENCGGTFYKVYEMSRITFGEIQTRYAVNVKYMKPKRENIRGRYKSRLQPTESIDLTSGQPRIVRSVAETVSLDDDGGASTENTDVADKFIQEFHRTVAFTRDVIEMQCPICQERVKRKLFCSHIDGCKGIVQRVTLVNRAPGAVVVQNGMEEHRPSLNREQQDSNNADRQRGRPSLLADYQRIKRQRFP